MSSLTLTQISPVANTVSVSPQVNPMALEVTEQVVQHTVVVSPQNITNYYGSGGGGGGGEVSAQLTGVPAQSNDLGTFSGSTISDNTSIYGALSDLELALNAAEQDVVSNSTAVANNAGAISTNAGDIATNASGVSTNAGAIATNAAGISANAGAVATNATGISTNASDVTAVSQVANSNFALIQSLQTDLTNVSESELTQPLDPTETQLFFTDPGTFPTGTSIESILRQLLIHFQPPVMTLGGWTTGTYEHGYSWSDTDFTLSFSNAGNVNTADTGVAAFSDSFIANGSNLTVTASASQTVSFSRSGTLLVDNGSPAGQSGTSTTRSSAAKLTLSGFTDSQGSGIQNRSASSTVRYRYWVISSTTRIDYGNLTNQNGTTLITGASSLTGSGSGTIESNLMSSLGDLSINSAGTYDYVYWIYASAWSVSNINNPLGLPIYTGDTTGSTTAAINYIGTFTLTNQHGADVSMTVLRTKNSGALGSGSYTVS